jgi:hypothetical protein
MPTLPIVFKDEVQLLKSAEEFIDKDRLVYPENDVDWCIPAPHAK